jgi:hypothetical protein
MRHLPAETASDTQYFKLSELRASMSCFENVEQAHVIVLSFSSLGLGVYLHGAEQAL